MISFRLNDDELARVKIVTQRALKRNHHLKQAHVYRELMGVIDTGLITPEERAFLKGEIRIKETESHAENNNEITPLLFDESNQRRLMSGGSDKPLRKKRSQTIQNDIEDATKDAIERTRRKKSSP